MSNPSQNDPLMVEVRGANGPLDLDLEEVPEGTSLADPMERLTSAYEEVVEGFKQIGYNSPADLANFADTPKRAAKGMLEIVKPLPYIKAEISGMLKKTFPSERNDSGMVHSIDNKVFGLCPHHLLPIVMRVSIAYCASPGGAVIGISKLSRIAALLAARPVLQEQYTIDLADVFFKGTEDCDFEQMETRGSMASVEALHMCSACRGAKAYQTRVVTNVPRGIFKDNQETRSEFFSNIQLSRMGNLL